MVAYGAADLLDYAPVAKQDLAAGAMSVFDMCKAIVELSDNTCANLLLARTGGPAALTAFWRATGDTVSRLDHKRAGAESLAARRSHDTTTPAAMAGNLRRFLLGDALSPGSREHLTEWMVGCKTGNNRAARQACRRIGRSVTRPATTARTPPAISRSPGQRRAGRC